MKPLRKQNARFAIRTGLVIPGQMNPLATSCKWPQIVTGLLAASALIQHSSGASDEDLDAAPVLPVARFEQTGNAPLPPIECTSFTGESTPLQKTFFRGKPLLIAIWANVDKPSREALRSVARRREVIKSQDLDVLALAVDANREDTGQQEDAKSFLERIEYPFSAGRAPEELLETLGVIQEFIFDTAPNLVLPTALLIDDWGRIAVLYQGPGAFNSAIEDTESFSRNSDGQQQQSNLPRISRAKGPSAPSLQAFASELLEKGPLRVAYRFLEVHRMRLVIGEDFPALLFLLGQRFNEEKLFKHAERYFAEAVKRRPSFANAQYTLGLIQQDWSRFDAAIASYRRATRADPQLSQPHLMWGLALEAKSGSRGFREAIEHYEKAVELDPGDPLAQFHLGRGWEKTGHPDRALAAYRSALAIDPGLARARQRVKALED